MLIFSTNRTAKENEIMVETERVEQELNKKWSAKAKKLKLDYEEKLQDLKREASAAVDVCNTKKKAWIWFALVTYVCIFIFMFK